MMKNKGKYKGSSSKDHKFDLSKVMCHHCKEAGHFKLNCPKLKKEDKEKKERKRVLMAAWENLENDSNEEEEYEGEDKDCFMAGNNNLDEFVISSSNTKNTSSKSGIGYVSTLEEKCDEVYTSETEPSPRTDPSSNRPENQAQKKVETGQNQENRNSVQPDPETAVAKNSRDNSILSHESEGDPEDSSTQSPLVTESASKSTRPREWRFLKNYPEKFVIGDVSQGVRTRSSIRKANEGSTLPFSHI
ncbi:uncharacterized protein LOC107493327 [Arachis duranensis]|uniref:Uncharacterized protein LOC107493327 n=1 Tax=Arachis duranensis TaxID=130453 RepID=A0A6P4DNZ1_ARADU|nr:uncharacterized protein LOC107493327 [Arachis duranensis]